MQVWIPHIHLAGPRETLADIESIYSRTHAQPAERSKDLSELIQINQLLLDQVRYALHDENSTAEVRGTAPSTAALTLPTALTPTRAPVCVRQVDLTEDASLQDIELPEMSQVILPMTWLPSSLRQRQILPQLHEEIYVLPATADAVTPHSTPPPTASSDDAEVHPERAIVKRHTEPYAFIVELKSSREVRELKRDDQHEWWRDVPRELAVGDQVFMEVRVLPAPLDRTLCSALCHSSTEKRRAAAPHSTIAS